MRVLGGGGGGGDSEEDVRDMEQWRKFFVVDGLDWTGLDWIDSFILTSDLFFPLFFWVVKSEFCFGCVYEGRKGWRVLAVSFHPLT